MIISLEIFKVLETSSLFQGVPHKLLLQQLSEARLCTLNSGEILFSPSQSNSEVYIILSGRISIQSDYSDVEPLAMLGEGECVGEKSIIGDVQVTAYFIAATDCKLLAIDHAAIWQLIDNSHKAAHNVLSVLSLRIYPDITTQQIEYNHNNGFSGSSITNEVTGLYNRQWIEEKIDRYLRRYIYDKKPSCLMMVVIDRFDKLCEKYGQLGCEQILRHTAHTMLTCLRPDDQAGHFLTEQFAVFMPDTTLSNGCIAAERVKKMIDKSVVVLPSGDALPAISVSLGVCEMSPGDTPASLFTRANKTLQLARISGGNCIKYCDNDTVPETTIFHKFPSSI